MPMRHFVHSLPIKKIRFMKAAVKRHAVLVNNGNQTFVSQSTAAV
ncbi:hypothetical protein K2D_17370 [Planctomycetes bacterium K2D]|uniref:Uncharacterized protein n=1 Tax=Botrimarina mediterranea TaxID=2528022 RepID=A0A518K6Y6_9BACT|nr:hypothetical protein Spa11_17380 [Botrimarina mediterranea]QDV78131.1 hypothetical protein K2D_17370 [Planctomycetes bacterium K2D]